MTKSFLIFVILFCVLSATSLFAESWKFGIMSDSQWPTTDDGKNPNTVAVDMINQVQKEFIDKKVKFVVQVGDLTDNGSIIALDTRATYVQSLYNAGIGFFPIRGNHESSKISATEFNRLFPQTKNGENNQTPNDAFIYTDSSKTHPEQKKGNTFTIGTHFTSPRMSLSGLSYSFTYNNATFVFLDQFTPSDSSMNSISSQQSWINSVLSSRDKNSHAFVFSHKGLIQENHADNLFGENPGADSAATNSFIASLAKNTVHFLGSGHDHMHDRSMITTTDGLQAQIQQIIFGSDSYKFYTPVNPSNDYTFNFPLYNINRQIPIAQDLYTISFYIVTIEGNKAIVDYYAVFSGQKEGAISTCPILTGNWIKKESFGFCLNGKQFTIKQNDPYTVVVDSFCLTKARILSGINMDSTKDGSGRPLSQRIGTGWTSVRECSSSKLISNIFSIFGMTNTINSQSPQYTLSLSYFDKPQICDLLQGNIYISKKQPSGKWLNAVEDNFGGKKQFVFGPWKSTYPLGTYGIDTSSNTAWAILNVNGDFAIEKHAKKNIVQFIYTSDPHYGIARTFRGKPNTAAQIVNQSMIAKINSLPFAEIPKDSGIGAGMSVGPIDYIVETGDICNRQELSANIQSDSISWSQFKSDYLDGITLTNNINSPSQFLFAPGNHDVSNAIGFYKSLNPSIDPTSMVAMYNMMIDPLHPKTNTTYNYATDKIHYSRDIKGIHFVFVNMWPDSEERSWLTCDLAKIPDSTPVIIFTHDQPDVESKHFTNPNGLHDINGTDKFENLLSEQFKDGSLVSAPATIEQKALASFFSKHPNIVAYFHGNDNANEFYSWNGIKVFRVDSPMKGNISSTDETKLSFQFVSIDVETQKMTVRECLWNDSSSATSPIKWGESTTMSLVNNLSAVTTSSELTFNNKTKTLFLKNVGKSLIIKYANNNKQTTTIHVSNALGRNVATFSPNKYETLVSWNFGKDNIAPGVYFITLKKGSFVECAKINMK